MNIDFTLPEVAKRFREHIAQQAFNFNDERIRSVMDFLHVCYVENRGKDTAEISKGFNDLESYMEGISLKDNDAIFLLICGLCDLYDKRAFQDGLQLGAYLVLELQGK